MTATTVWAFIGLLIKIIPHLWEWFRTSPQEFAADVHAVISNLKEAKTPEQKQEAAKDVQKLIRKL